VVGSAHFGSPVTFGAAKPVPVNPRKYRNYRKGDIIVSSAGVVTNLGLSVVFTILFALVGLLGRAAPPLQPGLMILQQMTQYGVLLNLVLCFFNLIPIPRWTGRTCSAMLPPELGARHVRCSGSGFCFCSRCCSCCPGSSTCF
jgi:Zn-dependent protease